MHFKISKYTLTHSDLKIKFYLFNILKYLREVKNMDDSKHIFDIKYPERIKELRQGNDLTQKEVAELLKIGLIEKLIATFAVAVRIIWHRNHEVASRTSWFLFLCSSSKIFHVLPSDWRQI